MNTKEERQIVTVRGIAAAIQAMHTPTWQAVKALMAKFGWKLTRDDSNKQTNNESSNS